MSNHTTTEDDALEFHINTLMGFVKHTHSFDDDPIKKARQLERNKQAKIKAKAAIIAWSNKRVAEERKAAKIEQATKATQHKTMTAHPMGGISNIEYVALHDLERDLKELQAQNSDKK